MGLHRHVMMGMVAILASSCVTRSLWRATDPQEYVSVPQSEVSESELQAPGVSYHKDDQQGVYYVEKTNLRRLGDYTIRALAAPATVVIDAGTVIVVVGAAAGLLVGTQAGMRELDNAAQRSGGRTRNAALAADGATIP